MEKQAALEKIAQVRVKMMLKQAYEAGYRDGMEKEGSTALTKRLLTMSDYSLRRLSNMALHARWGSRILPPHLKPPVFNPKPSLIEFLTTVTRDNLKKVPGDKLADLKPGSILNLANLSSKLKKVKGVK